MNKSSLEITDAESAAVQKTAHRVTLQDLEDQIEVVDYINPEIAPQMTIAVMKMKNGYVVLGQTAPADPENFNADLGKKFAREDAVRKVWPLLGFTMCDRVTEAKKVAEQNKAA